VLREKTRKQAITLRTPRHCRALEAGRRLEPAGSNAVVKLDPV
jgi:hypothetical protein